ncbi:MAG: hypothetical protein M1818_003810 [Claussenomyces sp. TS43310]|nr:MAG: hypothetical protein M1818_003810 [Claussenomyces sp. TS43310]
MVDLDGGRSPVSTIAASEMDEHTMTASSPMRGDPRTSLQHVLGNSHSRQQTPVPSGHTNDDMTEDEDRGEVNATKSATKAGGSKSASKSKSKAAAQINPSNNASIYTGSKIRHLKKDDGEPLWRKDIQYDFLRYIFEDETKCFTNSYEPDNIGKQTFADIYIDAMARSSKTSKILRDKLLSEHEPAKNMAMVCLLVNLGRMNTTLNFFPEMRAQLRTYHAIPSLQAHQDPNSYKQLQDAPRLKSILKGASEDRPEPNSLEKIKELPLPRTNPVNLIFVLAQFAPKVTELHFPTPRDFYDLIMRTSLSSKSRATAFLWLMWHYLESDFTEEGAAENPFGAGVDYGQDVSNQGVPRFEYLSEEQVENENVDTPEETEYGQAKMKERKRIIEADQAAFQAEYGPPKRGPKPKLSLPAEEGGASPISAAVLPLSRNGKPSKYDSDVDSTRSTPPPRTAPNMRIQSVLNGSKRGAAKHQVVEGSSPAPSGGMMVEGSSTRRSRPLTAHQLAVEHNRNQRVNYILSRGLRRSYHETRKLRKQEGAIYRGFKRMVDKVDEFGDSEAEENRVKDPGSFRERGYRGLVQLNIEEDDFGEELASYAAAFRRMGRRLDRWDSHRGGRLGVMGTNRVISSAIDDDTEDDKADGQVNMEEDLDEMDKELLGLGSDVEGEEDLDEVEKALLGMPGEETEEEVSDGGMDMD